MPAKKSRTGNLVSVAGAMKLAAHATMGMAMGLTFGLMLIVTNPALRNLLQQGGASARAVFVGTLLTTFAIGATLTGAVFMVTEGDDFPR